MSTQDRYYKIQYGTGVLHATLMPQSDCGPIQVTISSDGRKSQTTYFRPDSPVYNVQNTAVGGNVSQHLTGQTGSLDVAAITFTNNSLADGNVSLKVAIDDPGVDPNDQQKVDFADRLAAGKSITIQIVYEGTQ